MKRTKEKGITLIALVITIIVLIILAGISINLILGDNGIITKANEAKLLQEKTEIKENTKLEIVAKQIKNKGTINQSEIEEILEKYGTVNKNDDGTITSLTPTDKDYEIPFEEIYSGQIGSNTPEEPEEPEEPEVPEVPTVPTTVEQAKSDYVVGKTEVLDSLNNTVIIPNGFKVSENSGKSIDEGIVIVDKKGNEFVWIPVQLGDGETFESKYPRTQFANNEPKNNDISYSYREPYQYGYDDEKKEYEAMIDSVNLNKGFYIGRYETGFIGDKEKESYTSYSSDPTQEEIEEETKKLVVQQGAQIYNYVPWGSDLDDITAYNAGTAEEPEYVIGAVQLATNFDEVNNYSGVTSTLMYGIQWDMVMRYVADEKHNVNDSSSWGNFSNYRSTTGDSSTECGKLLTSGKNSAWQAKKIYNLAGNVYEWTMECYWSSNRRVCRGRKL